MVLLVTEGLVVEMAFGPYIFPPVGRLGLKVRLGLSRQDIGICMSGRSTAQTLGRFSILLKYLAVFGTALAVF